MILKTNGVGREYLYITLLIMLVCFHAINNFIILKQDYVPLYFDEGGFYAYSVSYYRYLFSSPGFGKFFHHFHSISNFYPPLFFISKMPFYLFLGTSEDAGILANIPFLFILIYFTFLIGRYIATEKAGLLAAFLVSFYPGIYGFSRTNFMTIAMAASVAMSLYFLLRSECFSIRKFSALLGFSIGLGLLIKWVYLIYIFPAIVLCIFRSCKRQKENNPRPIIINLSIMILMTMLIASPWYLPNIKNLFPMIFNSSYDNPNWANYINSLKLNPFRLNLVGYIGLMERYHLFTFYTFLFIFFIYRFIISRNDNAKWTMLVSLIIPYIIFNFAIVEYYSGELNPRYIIPLYSLVAIITAKEILRINKNIYRQVLIISVILIGLLQFYWIYYSKTSIGVYTKEYFQKRTTRGLLSPRVVDWKLDEIVDVIRDNRALGKTNILIIPHTPLTSALSYRLELKKDSNLIFPLSATFSQGEYGISASTKYMELINRADFVLTKEGGRLTYDDSDWIKDALAMLTEQFERRKGDFILLKEISIDTDEKETRFLIYKKNTVVDINAIKRSEPKGEGVLINAVDFNQGNLTYSEEFGLLIDGGILPAYVTYEIILPKDGNYEVWVRYATQKERPVDIYFDNTLKRSNALTTFTNGWAYLDARWFKEMDLIDVEKGRHLLKFIAISTPFPHIDAIKLIYKSNK